NFEVMNDGSGPSGDLHLLLAFDNDGMLVDHSGYHHDATCSGNCPLAIGGHVGTGAVSFDGTQCIHVGDAPDLRPDTFTFAAWALDAGTDPFMFYTAIWRAYQGVTTDKDAFGIGFSGSTTWSVDVAGITNTGPYVVGWHHYAGVYDGNAITTYFDG